MPDFYARVAKVRDKWLAALEADADTQPTPKPSYEVNDLRCEWSGWRLDMIRSVREACAILRENSPTAR